MYPQSFNFFFLVEKLFCQNKTNVCYVVWLGMIIIGNGVCSIYNSFTGQLEKKYVVSYETLLSEMY